MHLFDLRTLLAILVSICVVFQAFPLATVPLNKNLILGQYMGYHFGVFGWCFVDKGVTIACHCKFRPDSIETYKYTDQLLFPSLYKVTISTLLVVHPVSFAFTCILWIMALIIRLSRFGRCPIFILSAATWSLAAFLLALLSALVDLLLFVNKLKWPGCLVLASVPLMAICCSWLWSLRRQVSAIFYERKAYATQTYSRFDSMELSHIDTKFSDDQSIYETYTLERVPYSKNEAIEEPALTYYTSSS